MGNIGSRESLEWEGVLCVRCCHRLWGRGGRKRSSWDWKKGFAIPWVWSTQPSIPEADYSGMYGFHRMFSIVLI